MKPVAGGILKQRSSELSLLYRGSDIVLILLAHHIASAFWSVAWHPYRGLKVAVVIIAFLLISEAMSLYHSWRTASVWSEIKRMTLVWLGAVLVLILGIYFSHTANYFSRLVTLSWFVLAPALMALSRLAVRWVLNWLRRAGRNTRTLVFAGAGACSEKIARQLQNTPWMGFKVVGVYDDRSAARLEKGALALLGSLQQLIEEARRGSIDYVYITLPMHAEKRIIQLVTDLADTTASVYVVPDMFISDLLHARWTHIGEAPAVSVYETPFAGVNGVVKRGEDIVIGSLILLLISPLLLAIAIGVKLTSPGSVLFKQRRYGLNGEVVEVWKFRSMTVTEDGDNVPQATKGDRRITRFGGFLRRTSLDELPQFFNVIQGHMSIVGPRPHAVSHNEFYRRLIHGYMLRHKVKPGITGWAQVNGWRGETETLDKMEKRVEFDLQYVRNWSLMLDIKIILMTIFKGFRSERAY